jgi:hypothetical protein
VHAAPAVSCAKSAQKNAHEHTGSAEAIRHSLRNGFTAYIVLSPATGLSCHRHRRDTSRQLDASVGASGPHVFAVRITRRSSSSASASTASRPAAVTIACRPSVGRDSESYSSDLGFGKTEIFLPRGLDRQATTLRADLPVRQIRRPTRRHREWSSHATLGYPVIFGCDGQRRRTGVFDIQAV